MTLVSLVSLAPAPVEESDEKTKRRKEGGGEAKGRVPEDSAASAASEKCREAWRRSRVIPSPLARCASRYARYGDSTRAKFEEEEWGGVADLK